MCGISVIISNSVLKSKELHLLNERIKHRGPDDEGYLYLDQNNNLSISGGNSTPSEVTVSKIDYTPQHLNFNLDLPIRFGMAHRRLSIIDLSPSGHLPMSYLNRFWVTFNGEIYNYIELRDELILKGYKFTTNSDTEVILASYAEWSIDCVKKFVGMWSLVIFDSLLNEIFVTRDRFGIKPLYYYQSENGNLYIASEIKQFLAISGWNSILNEQRAMDFLNYGFTDHTDETLLKGVKIFPSSCFSFFRIEQIKEFYNFINYYNIQSSNKDFKTNNSTNLDFKNRLIESIKLHLRSDVEIGISLSGGLDSTSIAAVIKKCINSEEFKLKSFSSCSYYNQYSEKEYVDEVVTQFTLEPFYSYPDIVNLEKDLEDLIYVLDEPAQSMSSFLNFKLYELVKSKGVKVLINGQGADEYLGGYGQFRYLYLTKKLKKLRLNYFLNDLHNLNKNHNIPIIHIISGTVRNLFQFNKFCAKKNKYVNVSKQSFKHYKHPYSNNKFKNSSLNDIVKSEIYFSALPRYLRWEDRISMYYNIEARVPFLDHRIIDYCANLDVDEFENLKTSKVILRNALADILPDKINARMDKKGYVTPEEKWVKTENPELFKKLLINSVGYSRGFINNKIVDYYDDLIRGKVPFDFTYWRYIQFGYWMKAFNVDLDD